MVQVWKGQLFSSEMQELVSVQQTSCVGISVCTLFIVLATWIEKFIVDVSIDRQCEKAVQAFVH